MSQIILSTRTATNGIHPSLSDHSSPADTCICTEHTSMKYMSAETPWNIFYVFIFPHYFFHLVKALDGTVTFLDQLLEVN